MGFLFLVIVLLGISLNTATEQKVLTPLLSLAAVYGVTWWTIGRLLDLPAKKIVVAPWWMQSMGDDRLLEHRSPPRYTARRIKAARYTASCPICGGKISAQAGGWEFWGRIVGRCDNSPTEHVYSFDHITRLGKALR